MNRHLESLVESEVRRANTIEIYASEQRLLHRASGSCSRRALDQACPQTFCRKARLTVVLKPRRMSRCRLNEFCAGECAKIERALSTAFTHYNEVLVIETYYFAQKTTTKFLQPERFAFGYPHSIAQMIAKIFVNTLVLDHAFRA